jgi:hypothetical protein
VLVEEMGQTSLAEPDTDGEEARTVRPLQAVGRLRQSSDDLAFCKQSTDRGVLNVRNVAHNERSAPDPSRPLSLRAGPCSQDRFRLIAAA